MSRWVGLTDQKIDYMLIEASEGREAWMLHPGKTFTGNTYSKLMAIINQFKIPHEIERENNNIKIVFSETGGAIILVTCSGKLLGEKCTTLEMN